MDDSDRDYVTCKCCFLVSLPGTCNCVMSWGVLGLLVCFAVRQGTWKSTAGMVYRCLTEGGLLAARL